MKNRILDIIMDDKQVLSRRLSDSFFKKNYCDLYNEIINRYSGFNVKFIEMLYLIVKDIKDIPKCKICNNNVRFKNFTHGYVDYCSMKCIGLDNAVKKKREKTNNRKYGGKYPFNSLALREKIKQTNINKYGTEFPQKLELVKEKVRQTNINKYGVEQHLKLSSQMDKQRKTNLEKYNTDNVLKLPSVREKVKQTNINKYNCEFPQKLCAIKDKAKGTNLKKYGTEYPFQCERIKAKIKSTNLKRYGSEIPSKSEIVKNKIIEKNRLTKQRKFKRYWSEVLNLKNDDIFYDDESNIILKNYCKKHDEFIITKGLLKNRLRYGIENICTKCNPIGENSSIKEAELRNFIECELNIKTKKIKIDNMEIDIYLPNNNLGIEFDGLYWHSNLFKDNKYHFNKTELCEKNKIQLLHIFEDEWLNKKEIVKSIIKSKLNISNRKIYGRKTKIKKITDDKLVREFLDNNHLQGYVKSSIRLGLFYDNELVSLMTFGKKRIALGSKTSDSDEYELLRFCSKLNTIVIGGASKLLEYFINNYGPSEILTFADRRYSRGNLYEELGFKFIENTKPNYWYFNNKIKDLIRHHRYNFRKDALIKQGYESSETEKEIMEKRGYLWIYDCGNKKYKLYFPRI